MDFIWDHFFLFCKLFSLSLSILINLEKFDNILFEFEVKNKNNGFNMVSRIKKNNPIIIKFGFSFNLMCVIILRIFIHTFIFMYPHLHIYIYIHARIV